MPRLTRYKSMEEELHAMQRRNSSGMTRGFAEGDYIGNGEPQGFQQKKRRKSDPKWSLSESEQTSVSTWSLKDKKEPASKGTAAVNKKNAETMADLRKQLRDEIEAMAGRKPGSKPSAPAPSSTGSSRMRPVYAPRSRRKRSSGASVAFAIILALLWALFSLVQEGFFDRFIDHRNIPEQYEPDEQIEYVPTDEEKVLYSDEMIERFYDRNYDEQAASEVDFQKFEDLRNTFAWGDVDVESIYGEVDFEHSDYFDYAGNCFALGIGVWKDTSDDVSRACGFAVKAEPLVTEYVHSYLDGDYPFAVTVYDFVDEKTVLIIQDGEIVYLDPLYEGTAF